MRPEEFGHLANLSKCNLLVIVTKNKSNCYFAQSVSSFICLQLPPLV